MHTYLRTYDIRTYTNNQPTRDHTETTHTHSRQRQTPRKTRRERERELVLRDSLGAAGHRPHADVLPPRTHPGGAPLLRFAFAPLALNSSCLLFFFSLLFRDRAAASSSQDPCPGPAWMPRPKRKSTGGNGGNGSTPELGQRFASCWRTALAGRSVRRRSRLHLTSCAQACGETQTDLAVAEYVGRGNSPSPFAPEASRQPSRSTCKQPALWSSRL